MSLPVDFLICILAWSVPILRFRYVWASKAWKKDYVAMNIWLATLSFAVTVTFLFDQLGDAFDAWTTNNLSTYIAYCGVVLTLYFTTTASLYIPQTARSERVRRWLVFFLLLSLAVLSFFYWAFIYGLPQWRSHFFPDTLPEVFYRLTVYLSAFAMCVLMFVLNARYLRREGVILMRFRFIAIILTALISGVYLTLKVLLSLSYLFPVFASRTLYTASEVLFLVAALMWAGAFLNNKIYLSTFEMIRNLASWPLYKDLNYLIRRLDRLVEAVAGQEAPPKYRQYIGAADYYLYRALIRIMDGGAMLKDYFSSAEVEKPVWWGSTLQWEAEQLVEVLQDVPASDNYSQTLREYRLASRRVQLDPDSKRIQGK